MVIRGAAAPVYRLNYEYDSMKDKILAFFKRDNRIDGLCRKCRRQIETNKRRQQRKIVKRNAWRASHEAL